MTREDAIDYLSALWGSDSTSIDETIALEMAIKALEQEPCDKCIYSTSKGECQYDDIAETIPTEQEPKTDILGKIRAEIKEWYWQVDKQALAKDPCVVDAMIDLFIRTIDKYKAESEDKA